jgi:hypothetical protein
MKKLLIEWIYILFILNSILVRSQENDENVDEDQFESNLNNKY